LNASGPWRVEGDLARFWDEVEAIGSPLLSEGEDDMVTATFLWRDQSERQGIDMVVVSLELRNEPLALLAGTDIWFVDVWLPRDYAGGYCFHLGTDGVIFNEDLHEPWAMSFGDPLSRWPIHEEDTLYPRNIVRASGLPQPEQLRGEVHRVLIPSLLLDGPRPTPSFPVSVYEPPRSVANSDTYLPAVIFLNGQFVESSDALPLLDRAMDRAMDEGRLLPALLVIPDSLRSLDEHSAWGWRNRHGPHDLSAYLTQELLPALEVEHDLSGAIHLIAWGYAAHAAVRTAIGCNRVVSITLLNPIRVRDFQAVGTSRAASWPTAEWKRFDRIADDLVTLMRSSCFVQLSKLSPREDRPSREDSSEQLAAIVAAQTGRHLDRIQLSNADLVAGASALLPALARVLGER